MTVEVTGYYDHEMKQQTHNAINWLSYQQLEAILASQGVSVGRKNDARSLQATVHASVEDGTINENIILDY